MYTIFLFVVVFSCLCCIYNDIQHRSEATQQSESVNFAVAPSAPKFTEQPSSTIAPTDYSAAINEREFPVLEQIVALKLRDTRVVAKLLGIIQKVNGKDKSLNWLQREIRQKLTSDRAAVISALQQLKASRETAC